MRTSVSLVACLLLAALALPAGAQDAEAPNAPAFDHVHGGNVVPPGQTGHIGVPDAPAALNGTYPDNVTDQRQLYIDFERKDWSFAAPGADPVGTDPKDALGEPYNPAGNTDVTIYRDGWGVPRIFGVTDEAAQFGAGYAMAEDRLFQADVFRHVARGEMAGFIGGQSWYDYDREWRREFYTDDELLAMLDEFFTDAEQQLLQSYLDGINAYIEEALADPTKLPAEYPALAIVPEPWELQHSLAIFVLQARDSVEGFGQELYNTALLADLQDRYGSDEGRRLFEDIRFVRDEGAYTTAPPEEGEFAYPGGGFEGLDAPGIAMPDDPAAALAPLQERDALITEALEMVGFARKQASNAIPVGGELTADGRPILLGGPQLQYLVPSIFWEFEIHSPNQNARGVGFAGTAGVVLIGKTPTHAWSITYGYTDQIDVFLVPLDPAQSDTHYLRDGQSRPLETYETTVTCKADQVSFLTSPGASDLCDGLPVHQTTIEVVRVPEYGPVIGEVEVGGEPHAVVKVRGHWMREVQNGKPFVTFNRATTMAEFRAAQADFNISLNVNYVDHRGHFGFWHVARPPIRAQGTDIRLPTIGDGTYDWEGVVPLDDIPHAIDPEQGYTANWNNQIATGWHNGDQNYWGDYQRVETLARRMRDLAARGDITPEDIWRVNEEASYEDARVAQFRPLLEDAFDGGTSGNVAAALDIVLAWDAARTASQDDGGTWRYDDPAVAIWDRFFAELKTTVISDEFGDEFQSMIPDIAPAMYYLTPAMLVRVFEGRVAGDWMDGLTTDEAVRQAFEDAVAGLEADLGGTPDAWRSEAILTEYTAVGLGGADPHPFMNRGTYNQLAIVDAPGAQPSEPDGQTAGGEPTPPDASTTTTGNPSASPSGNVGATGGTPTPSTGGGLAALGASLVALTLTLTRRQRRTHA